MVWLYLEIRNNVENANVQDYAELKYSDTGFPSEQDKKACNFFDNMFNKLLEPLYNKEYQQRAL